jgi:hypothetical protein
MFGYFFRLSSYPPTILNIGASIRDVEAHIEHVPVLVRVAAQIVEHREERLGDRPIDACWRNVRAFIESM